MAAAGHGLGVPRAAVAAGRSACSSAHNATALPRRALWRPAAARPRPCTLAAASAASTDAAAASAPPDAANRLLSAAAAAPPRAAAGLTTGGCRGLLAAAEISPGDEILSIPLLSALVTPEHVAAAGDAAGGGANGACAAAAALADWQCAYALALPAALADFLVTPGVEWEARLAAWLLWLVQRRRARRAAAAQQSGTAAPAAAGAAAGPSAGAASAGAAAAEDLWDLYADSLPPPGEQSTFYDYSEAEAGAWLALSSWRDRAAAHRAEAAALHERYFAASTGTLGQLGLSGELPTTAWALGMVRSRTFGRVLAAGGGSSGEGDAAEGEEAAGGGGGGEGQEEGEELVTLLMVPGADLVNHSFDHNAEFKVLSNDAAGSDSNGSSSSSSSSSSSGGGDAGVRLVIRALRRIAPGEEVTISYGQDKSNTQLFANYGFALPGNPNDRVPLPPTLAAFNPSPTRRPAAAAASYTLTPGGGELGSSAAEKGSGGSGGGGGGSSGGAAVVMQRRQLDMGYEELVAEDPGLLASPGWWRRHGALLSLNLEPPVETAGAGSGGGCGGGGGSGDGGGGTAEQGGVRLADGLDLSVSLCRQMERQLAGHIQKLEAEAAASGGGGCGSGGSSSRLAAALAAAREQLLLVRECMFVCEAELAAAGVTVT